MQQSEKKRNKTIQRKINKKKNEMEEKFRKTQEIRHKKDIELQKKHRLNVVKYEEKVKKFDQTLRSKDAVTPATHSRDKL